MQSSLCQHGDFWNPVLINKSSDEVKFFPTDHASNGYNMVIKCLRYHQPCDQNWIIGGIIRLKTEALLSSL